MTVRYDMLPPHMREGAKLYVEKGIEPGGFMMAVLCNDLMSAFGRADYINTAAMGVWVNWLYDQCPSIAKGSEEAVRQWIEKGGMEGTARR